jgi:hypothetical protein
MVIFILLRDLNLANITCKKGFKVALVKFYKVHKITSKSLCIREDEDLLLPMKNVDPCKSYGQ